MTETLSHLPPWALLPNMPNPYFEEGNCVHGAVRYTTRDLADVAKGKPVTYVPIHKLVSELDRPVWLGNCVPMDVIVLIKSGVDTTDHIYTEHIDRILYADISYPIIIDSYYGILDGYHRLAQHYIRGSVTVNCIMLQRVDLKSIRHYISC